MRSPLIKGPTASIESIISLAYSSLFDRAILAGSCYYLMSHDRVTSKPPGRLLIDTIVFWFLGSALFITIAFVPAVLLGVFYSGFFVHGVVLSVCCFIFLLLWLASKYQAPRTRHLST